MSKVRTAPTPVKPFHLSPKKIGPQLHTHDERLQHLETLVAELVKKVSFTWPYDPDVWGSLVGTASSVDQLTARIEAIEQGHKMIAAAMLALLAKGVTQVPHIASAN